MARLALILLLIFHATNGEVFSSTAHLSNVLNTEGKINTLLKGYVDETERLVIHLRRYIDSFHSIPTTTTNDDELVENPIHSYLLLKYLTVDWKRLEKIINSTSIEEIIRDIQINRESVPMPQEEDLHGAALALLRLQETYQLTASDLARGNILGIQSPVELSARDCFYLGAYSSYSSLTKLAVEWFTHALRVVEDDYSMDQWEIERQLEKSIIENEDTSNEELSENSYVLEHDRATVEEIKHFKMKNYQALCRGEHLRNSVEESTLFCYLSNREDPYFSLMPIRVEIQSHDPLISVFHDVIHDSEIEFIKQYSTPLLIRSEVAAKEGDKVSNVRTSQNTWLYDEYQNEECKLILKNIMDRMSWITRLNIYGEKYSEALQVANYGIGGHYEPHNDFLHRIKSNYPNFEARGDRIATLMFYLSDVERGGATVFPHIGVAVRPKRGSAVFWYNLMKNGDPDTLTLHGACPVLVGSKWVGNKWITERNQLFKRPCSMNSNE